MAVERLLIEKGFVSQTEILIANVRARDEARNHERYIGHPQDALGMIAAGATTRVENPTLPPPLCHGG